LRDILPAALVGRFVVIVVVVGVVYLCSILVLTLVWFGLLSKMRSIEQGRVRCRRRSRSPTTTRARASSTATTRILHRMACLLVVSTLLAAVTLLPARHCFESLLVFDIVSKSLVWERSASDADDAGSDSYVSMSVAIDCFCSSGSFFFFFFFFFVPKHRLVCVFCDSDKPPSAADVDDSKKTKRTGSPSPMFCRLTLSIV
jgi:hypothetical protein